MAHDMNATTNVVSKIKLPGSETVYEIHDASAIHSLEDLELAQIMQFKGTVATKTALNNIPNKAVGDVWYVTEDDCEYVWADKNDDGTGDEWEALGNVHDAASSTHEHTATVTEADATYNVTGGKVTVATVSAETVNVPVVDIENAEVSASKVKTAGTVTAGQPAEWQAKVESGVLSFTWAANEPTAVTLPTFDAVTASKVAQGTAKTVSKVTTGSGTVDVEEAKVTVKKVASIDISEPVEE